MLYKNDVKVPWTQAMEKQLMDEIGSWPMVVKMPPSAYTKSPGNDTPDRPKVHPVPLMAIRGGEEGSETWHYCTQASKNTAGNMEYWVVYEAVRSKHIDINGSFTIEESRKDLGYFLAFLSPWREIPGETDEEKRARGIKPSQRFLFVIENKEKEATAALKNRKARVDIEYDILSKMELSKVREIASAFHIPYVDDMGDMQVRERLLQEIEKIEKKERTGYDKFRKLAKSDENTLIRSTIQKALDLKIIGEDEAKNEYVYLNAKGKRTKAITGPTGTRTLRESVEHYMEHNPAEFDTLQMEITEKEALQTA